MKIRNNLMVLSSILFLINILLLFYIKTINVHCEMLSNNFEKEKVNDRLKFQSVIATNKLLYSLASFNQVENISLVAENGDSVFFKSILKEGYK